MRDAKGILDSVAVGRARPSGGWHTWICRLFPVLLIAIPLAGQAADGPVRVEIASEHLEVAEGAEARITVRLVNRNGQPVPATKPMNIQVTVSGSRDGAMTLPVAFRPGEAIKQVDVPARETGALSVAADHEELLKGEVMLRVLSAPRMEALRRVPAAAESVPESAVTGHPEIRDHRIEIPPAIVGERPDIVPEVEAEERPNTVAVEEEGEPVVDDSPGTPSPRRSLALQGVPDRPLRADGQDAARIYAFLQGEASPTDINVRLIGSRGAPNPINLTIPGRQTTGKASLTTEAPGKLMVRYVSSDPDVEIAGSGELAFDVHPPVDELDVVPRLEFDVGDEVTLAASLVDTEGIPVQSMEPRTVHFDVVSGKVRVGAGEAEIVPGESGARTSLRASWWGAGAIEVWTPNLAKKRVVVEVRMPWSLLGVTALGGTLGGLFAWFHGPRNRRRLVVRLLTGLVAGLVLYWLLMYLAVVPEMAVSNPVGAFCSAVIGGWLGTEVFEFGARRLGIVRPAT